MPPDLIWLKTKPLKESWLQCGIHPQNKTKRGKRFWRSFRASPNYSKQTVGRVEGCSCWSAGREPDTTGSYLAAGVQKMQAEAFAAVLYH